MNTEKKKKSIITSFTRNTRNANKVCTPNKSYVAEDNLARVNLNIF